MKEESIQEGNTQSQFVHYYTHINFNKVKGFLRFNIYFSLSSIKASDAFLEYGI